MNLEDYFEGALIKDRSVQAALMSIGLKPYIIAVKNFDTIMVFENISINMPNCKVNIDKFLEALNEVDMLSAHEDYIKFLTEKATHEWYLR